MTIDTQHIVLPPEDLSMSPKMLLLSQATVFCNWADFSTPSCQNYFGSVFQSASGRQLSTISLQSIRLLTPPPNKNSTHQNGSQTNQIGSHWEPIWLVFKTAVAP